VGVGLVASLNRYRARYCCIARQRCLSQDGELMCWRNSPIDDNEYVGPCHFLCNLPEELLFPDHHGRLPVHNPHKEVGVHAETIDPNVQVGVNVDAYSSEWTKHSQIL
jgi:hypothetical protein